jgi:hypothetical protein
MIKSVLEHIGGVGIYGVLSICIFFTFFLSVLFWAARLKRRDLEAHSALPLEDSTPAHKSETPSETSNL